MELYGQTSKSIPQKVTIHVLEILILWLSFWILFQNGGSWVENNLHIHNATGYTGRRKIIFAFSVVTFLRFTFMMTVLLKRAIPWEESLSVPFAFVLYFVGFALFALPVSKPVDFIDIFGIILFVAGCVLNTGGEILRNQWKKKPVNKGKIYTKGFFKYARHINYFGDLLWVTAYAVITRNWYAVSIPIFLFCLFAFYNAPKLDKYLKDKYGKDYDNYAKQTKMLIPFVY
jgi:protein-S-isoprenylcysteine O-methyltransferase Ste14